MTAITILDMRETYQNVVPTLVNDVAVDACCMSIAVIRLWLDIDAVHRLVHRLVDELLGVGWLDARGVRVERVV